MKTIGTICARGGSTGVPRKNVKQLLGKPLIAHTIEQALACKKIDAVYVSTDDLEIAEVSKKYGAIVPFLRPKELATSDAGKLEVIIHLVEHLLEEGEQIARIVDLDPTSPLRTVEDVDAAIAVLDQNTDCVITGYPADKNPYFNMVEQKDDGFFRIVKSHAGKVLTRQSAPDVFAMNASIYVWHLDTLRQGIWTEKTKLYEMPHERSVDIDNEIDFKLVELLMHEAMAGETSNV